MGWISDAADVFSAVGTVGAFGVALYLLRKEQQREGIRVEAERRAQATQVSAWLEARPTSTGARELMFCVHNASDMPIYEVSLPGLTPGLDGEAEFIGLVPPGQTITRPAPHAWIKTYLAPEPIQLTFNDSSGNQWIRDEQGVLTDVPENTRRPL
jgi:hypothetical protein